MPKGKSEEPKKPVVKEEDYSDYGDFVRAKKEKEAQK